jgi:hypothetical protein
MSDPLENLVKIGSLKAEASDPKESAGLMHSAKDRLHDACIAHLSFASRFDLAYNAAHALALYALREAGYRTDKRYLVFQCLIHTTPITKIDQRIFALCHERRNLAEYEGYLDVDENLLAELIKLSRKLLTMLEKNEKLSH